MKTLIFVLFTQLFAAAAQGSEMPSKPLRPCPDSPNCVSTAEARFGIAPLRFHGTLTQSRDELVRVIKAMPRSAIVESQGACLHATFTSLLFRFVDDVEFFFDEPNQVIHMRSASRVGRYDFGVNRERLEDIMQRYEQTH